MNPLIFLRKQHSAVAVFALATVMALATAPAQATSLTRMDLESLTRESSVVMVAKVVDSFSYWNEDGTTILTEVTVEEELLLKGAECVNGFETPRSSN